MGISNSAAANGFEYKESAVNLTDLEKASECLEKAGALISYNEQVSAHSRLEKTLSDQPGAIMNDKKIHNLLILYFY